MSMVNAAIDYAKAEYLDHWLHHYALGDPSWDTFVREPGNPIYRGRLPYEWPVNGFLFRDPPTGTWYAYVGLYPRGYWPAGPCRILREQKSGIWEELGLAVQGDASSFDGDGSQPGATPDVSVVYADGRYHMVYDWANPQNTRGGLAYAWADRPEGPFHRARAPLHEDTNQPPIQNRYVRSYAATLIRRSQDWIILHNMSTPGNAGGTWAMACMTSKNPEGPYTTPTLLLYPQAGTYLPPYLEYYPAFVHQGYIYAPATSVALNRNYQCVFHAPIEQAHLPEAWQLYQHGSIWHAVEDPSEAHGIWGQTFSAQVDPSGVLRAYFTSKTRDDIGTVHLAHRPWDRPYQNGFILSAPNVAAVAVLRQSYSEFVCDVTVQHSQTWALCWQCHGPLGTDTPAIGASMQPLARSNRIELRADGTHWRLISIDQDGHVVQLGAGNRESTDAEETSISIGQYKSFAEVQVDGIDALRTAIPARPGRLELIAEAGTHLKIQRFEVKGSAIFATECWLATEALAGAATAMGVQEWTYIVDKRFRYGLGYESATPHARAKWNYYGAGFLLYAPRHPTYGKVRITIDGQSCAVIDLHADIPQPSGIMHATDLPVGYHAVSIEPVNGMIPCDCLEVQPE